MAGFRVICDDWRSSRVYRTREDAERAIARIEAGGGCSLPHRIESDDKEAEPMRTP